MSILQFHESLVRSLFFDAAFENMKPSWEQQSVSRSKPTLAYHKLEEKEGSAYGMRKFGAIF